MSQSMKFKHLILSAASIAVLLQAAPTGAVAVRPRPQASVTRAPITLRDVATMELSRMAGVERSELRFNLNPSDNKTLGLGVLGDRFEFEPLAAAPVGRVPVIVRRLRGQDLAETYRLSVDVARRCLA